ncbi:MAG: MBL fold metallo-hydrolase, partial [Gemmataceae bacterium]
GTYTLEVLLTPGHTRDHTSFLLKKNGMKPIVFAGDALTGAGHIPTPFTTDWDHWTDAGLTPAAQSVRRIIDTKPRLVLPARGPGLQEKTSSEVMTKLAANLTEAAFLRSFDRYTRRLGELPKYDFLVPKEQVASGGDKPWSRVSPHLWVTGNTYVVVHPETQACLVVDPWGQQSIDQLAKLRAEKKLGPIERVLITHAHFDHFDGVYLLPNRPQYHLSTLDQVAGPLKDPRRFRAPFLDSRPIRFDQEYTDGARFDWGGQTWTMRHQPGQTVYTASFQTTIDSKRVLFTADNFFHHEQFSGTGGWMGLNRSFPGAYAESAQAVLDAKPDWILAEHGGPFEF